MGPTGTLPFSVNLNLCRSEKLIEKQLTESGVLTVKTTLLNGTVVLTFFSLIDF